MKHAKPAVPMTMVMRSPEGGFFRWLRYSMVMPRSAYPTFRGLHSSTFQLNLSRF